MNKHNEKSCEQILAEIDRRGFIGRHKFKTSNMNINKKLRRMVREGILVKFDESNKYCYYRRSRNQGD